MPEIRTESEPDTDKYERGAKKPAVASKVRLLLDVLDAKNALKY